MLRLPSTNKRDRLTLARQALDGGISSPVNADTAIAGPTGAAGMQGEVQQIADQSDMFQENMIPPETSIWTGEPGAGGGGTTYSEDAGQVSEDGEAPITGEMDPYQSFDDMAEEFNTSMLQDALNGVDTSEQERLMQEQTDRLLGQNLMDQRASAGAAGFGESGAMMAMEGGLRSDAARQQGLDIEQLRRSEAQRAIENAFKAQGMDIEKMTAAEQARLNELIASFLMNDGELPPEGGEDGGFDLSDLPKPGDITGSIGEGVAAADDELGDKFNEEEEAAIRGGTSDFWGTITTAPEYLFILLTEGQDAADDYAQSKYDEWVAAGNQG